jgi:hypothetical protein
MCNMYSQPAYLYFIYSYKDYIWLDSIIMLFSWDLQEVELPISFKTNTDEFKYYKRNAFPK